MRTPTLRTDNQRLKAMIYANGLTLEGFSAIIGRKPATIAKRLANPFYHDWRLAEIDRLDEAMQRIDPTYRHEDLMAIFFKTEPVHEFRKPIFLAVCELGNGITEQQAADKAGIPLEELRGLYNACDNEEKLAKAAKVWEAIGQKGNWYHFFLSFLNYPDEGKPQA